MLHTKAKNYDICWHGSKILKFCISLRLSFTIFFTINWLHSKNVSFYQNIWADEKWHKWLSLSKEDWKTSTHCRVDDHMFQFKFMHNVHKTSQTRSVYFMWCWVVKQETKKNSLIQPKFYVYSFSFVWISMKWIASMNMITKMNMLRMIDDTQLPRSIDRILILVSILIDLIHLIGIDFFHFDLMKRCSVFVVVKTFNYCLRNKYRLLIGWL